MKPAFQNSLKVVLRFRKKNNHDGEWLHKWRQYQNLDGASKIVFINKLHRSLYSSNMTSNFYNFESPIKTGFIIVFSIKKSHIWSALWKQIEDGVKIEIYDYFFDALILSY